MSGNPPKVALVDPYGRPLRASAGAAGSPAASQAFEAASTSRRMSNWGTSTAGPNDTVVSGLSNVRARSRELVRNNPWIDGGVDTFIAYLVGTSISPRWKMEDKTLKDDIQGLWAESVLEMDYDGVSDFYGQQEVASRGLLEAGECLYRKRIVRDEGLQVPFQIQVIEADLLDHMHTEVYKGNEIRFGIEFDSRQKRAAYWLYREHPGESYGWLSSFAGDKVRIPASEIGHVYRRLRAGQARGIPWLKSVITRAFELDKCEDAELVRRTVAGLFAGFFSRSVEEASTIPFGQDGGYDASSNRIVTLEPGGMSELPPGASVTFPNPPDAGQGFFDLTKHHLRAIATGSKNTYEKLTGDLSGVNFSSIRAGQNDFLQLIRQIQFHTLIFQLCRPVATAWEDLAVASGRLKIRDYAENKRAYQQIDWVPDAAKYVNPLQDVQADILEVRSGFKSRTQKIAERGGDIEKVDAEIEEENRRADEKGFILDTDPRRTAGGGSFQDTEQKPNGGSN